MKTAVVTGASRGLGRCVAEAFVKAGWRVVGTGRSERPAELDKAVGYHQFDAADSAACADFWQNLQLKDGEVCLVNNAGGYSGGKLLEAQPEEYEKQMQSNYFAGVYMTRGLVARVPAARIINVISSAALAPRPGEGPYGASKAAARHFYQSLQKELPTEKYQITNLYPSFIATSGPNPDAIDPNDLAKLIVELAESRASYYPADITLYPAKH
jgi:serine 3-dehydrogenase